MIDNLQGGVFNSVGDGDLTVFRSHSGHAFNNLGTSVRTGSGATFFNVPFGNSGTVEVPRGVLSFGSTYRQTAGETLINDGRISASGTLDIRGGVLGGARHHLR